MAKCPASGEGSSTATLAAIYRDDRRGSQVRGFATDTLADYLSDDAEGLFDLLADANAKQFAPIFDKLTAHQDRAIALGNAEVSKTLAQGCQRDRQRSFGHASGECRRDAVADECLRASLAFAETQPRSTSSQLHHPLAELHGAAIQRRSLLATNRKPMSPSSEPCCFAWASSASRSCQRKYGTR